MSVTRTRPPRDGYRAMGPGIEFRDADDGGAPVMHGYFSVFNDWTEIHSLWEGDFLERVAPGAYQKTFREQRPSMKVLFQHGMDPQIGDKPLGAITDLRERTRGAYYEVDLLDADYVRDTLLPGLRAGLYGASFRFSVIREEYNDDPGKSDHNPDGLPERVIKEARVSEFGPVTFPAYENATAGVRSVTDDFIMRCFAQDPERLRAMFERATNLRVPPVTDGDDARQDEQQPEPTDQDEVLVAPGVDMAATHPAPPNGDAAQAGHLVTGRRDPTKVPLYTGGGSRKEQWRL